MIRDSTGVCLESGIGELSVLAVINKDLVQPDKSSGVSVIRPCELVSSDQGAKFQPKQDYEQYC
jgi:hypothetical protein